MSGLPDNLITFGPNANCTLALCPIEWSAYKYQPSLAANTTFIVLFSLSLLLHLIQGIRYRTAFFATTMILGCITEILGYAGRVMLHTNPFNFNGFMLQICCITLAPVFFAAGIYVTLARITDYLDPALCRFSPKLYYWVFIPCDLVSLVLQAVGGAESSTSEGSSNTANYIALAGLSFQVFTLLIFIALALDYVVRYWSYRRSLTAAERKPLSMRFKVFAAFFSLAIILILVRCIYRIDELSDGYSGPLIRNEALFIGLEGVMIITAAFCLNIGHPGFAFQNHEMEEHSTEKALPSGFESDYSVPVGTK